MKIKSLVIASALALSASVSFAKPHFGVSYAQNAIDFGSVDAKPSSVQFAYGDMLSEHFGVEGRAAFSIGDDTVMGVDVEVENYYGIYAGYYFAPEATFNPYALIGYTNTTVGLSAGGMSESESESDISIGLGAKFKFSEDMFLTAEYMNVYDKDGVEVNNFSVGFEWTFF